VLREVLAPELTPQLRTLTVAATQRLLGSTIAITDRGWQTPSRLPGWSRAHIGAHLAHDARSLGNLAAKLPAARRSLRWPINEHDPRLEENSRRSGLDLQVDLDTSAARLTRLLDDFDDAAWDRTLNTPQGPLPARALFLAWLSEVTIHHVDLDCGYQFSQIEAQAAAWLLRWHVFRREPRFTGAAVRIHADDGFTATLGDAPHPVEVRGSTTALLGWLTGRLGNSSVLGAEAIPSGGAV